MIYNKSLTLVINIFISNWWFVCLWLCELIEEEYPINMKLYFHAVASLCYKSSVSANRVVLDGFLASQSLAKTCECTLTSSQSTTVFFAALSDLQPNYQGCNGDIRVQAGGTIFIISCRISGSVQISPSQPVTLTFNKPDYSYNANYCMQVNAGKKTK